MSNVKKIALLTSASGFENHKRIVRAIGDTLRELGDYALYVFTCYAAFWEDNAYCRGEKAIYELINHYKFDGCILEAALGDKEGLEKYEKILSQKGIPLITIDTPLDDVPCVLINAYAAQKEIVEHLITEHQCRKINLVLDAEDSAFAERTKLAYREVLEKYNLPFNEDRVLYQVSTVPNGRGLLDNCREKGIDDMDAVICHHDVLAIGLTMELEEQGYCVPEELRICSLEYSTNSEVFRPDITAVSRKVEERARKACQLLAERIEGKEVPLRNYVEGAVVYGESCGCSHKMRREDRRRYQDVIMAKIEARSRFDCILENIKQIESMSTIQELGNSIGLMMEQINHSDFLCCINRRDLRFILNEVERVRVENNSLFDDEMTVISGNNKKYGRVDGLEFSLKELYPYEVEAGDILIFMPIHYEDKVYGYNVFVNTYAPIDYYNNRVSYEMIGNSIENFKRQMKLWKTVSELDALYMKDALTGLYNRYAEIRYREKYLDVDAYCVVMVDMDNLKKINDTYSHQTGNVAIRAVAKALTEVTEPSEVVIRYGGDEFLILSHDTDTRRWDGLQDLLNEKLLCCAQENGYLFELGVSVGYGICSVEEPMEYMDCFKRADENMYKNKALRKKGRDAEK